MGSGASSLCDLAGRRIVIAGAAGGIGGETAKLCAKLGARLILADIAPASAIRERVGATVADAAEIHSLDFSHRKSVDAFAAQVGPVYGLIDTTGVALFDDWMSPDWDEALERVIRANIKSPINLTRAFLPGMIDKQEGRIVLCGSVAGWMGGIRTGPHYAFSKGGLHAFTRWLSRHGPDAIWHLPFASLVTPSTLTRRAGVVGHFTNLPLASLHGAASAGALESRASEAMANNDVRIMTFLLPIWSAAEEARLVEAPGR